MSEYILAISPKVPWGIRSRQRPDQLVRRLGMRLGGNQGILSRKGLPPIADNMEWDTGRICGTIAAPTGLLSYPIPVIISSMLAATASRR